MTRASRSRALRRFTTTLAPACVDAMQVIMTEYAPDKPLTKHVAEGILNDAVLLWAEMIKQKQEKTKDQGPRDDVTDTITEEQAVDDNTHGTEERPAETSDGLDTVSSDSGTGESDDAGSDEVR